jgi:hypothetical protein
MGFLSDISKLRQDSDAIAAEVVHLRTNSDLTLSLLHELAADVKRLADALAPAASDIVGIQIVPGSPTTREGK